MMIGAPKKNFGIFSKFGKFDKRWSTIIFMLESSEGGEKNAKYAGGGNYVCATPPLVAPLCPNQSINQSINQLITHSIRVLEMSHHLYIKLEVK